MSADPVVTRSQVDVRGLSAYLGFVFGISWAIEAVVGLLGGLTTSLGAASLILVMCIPALASWLTCSLVTHESWTAAVGLQRRALLERGWLRIIGWGAAGVGIIVIVVALAALLGQVTGWAPLDTSMPVLTEQLREASQKAGTAMPPVTAVLVSRLVAGLIAPFTINGALALGEELGWRGYLLGQLAPLGPKRAAIVTGAIWGLWHAPLIAMGYEYSWGVPLVVGVPLFMFVCIPVGVLLAYLRVRTGSSVTAAIVHGGFNAWAAMPLMFVASNDSRYLVLGSGVGVSMAIVGWVMASVLLVLPWRAPRWAYEEEPAPFVRPPAGVRELRRAAVSAAADRPVDRPADRPARRPARRRR